MNQLKALFILAVILLLQVVTLWTQPNVAKAQDLSVFTNSIPMQNNDEDDPPTCGDSDNDGECDPQTGKD